MTEVNVKPPEAYLPDPGYKQLKCVKNLCLQTKHNFVIVEYTVIFHLKVSTLYNHHFDGKIVASVTIVVYIFCHHAPKVVKQKKYLKKIYMFKS